ncbi:hypothetical protein LTR62_008699 [Meristemomyces frigidus]|uniref:Capsule polysaccharide biosynthesis protein n=1 Tax=Meristemomyces frigidus TaxID=1508187 RepID=A0AAN7TAM0_9PEZI|nr:hypothetical protein LTR62_008699 [Meristemomyces frigidus]
MAPAYIIPPGIHAISEDLLDLRHDTEIDHDIRLPRPITSEKNIWFFWDKGYATLLSKTGWTVRVLDRVPGSPLNVDQYLPITEETFPRAFVKGTVNGHYAAQHTSDLVRFPLLLKYGGVYADVGLMQIGDLNHLWNSTIASPSSPIEVISYGLGSRSEHGLANYFLVSGPDNPFFLRCHRLFLALWAEEGGKTSTEGMHRSPLISMVSKLEGEFEIVEEDGERFGPLEVSEMLTDYIAQGQTITMVQGLVDEEDGWDGPEYSAKHVFAIPYMEGSQLINEYTAWNGQRAFDLMSLPLAKDGEQEIADQKAAREIIEACLARSFGFKLAHGLILRVFKVTLGSLWRQHEGSDDVPETYAHWLRYGMVHWCPDRSPTRLEYEVIEPIKRGRLLGAQQARIDHITTGARTSHRWFVEDTSKNSTYSIDS